jgi:gliding motility-associated lipoprotein GldH
VKLSLASLTIVYFLFSCDSNKLFEKNIPINNSLWSNLEVISFDFPVDDTISKYNFYINIRNNTDYAFSNLYLFMNTIYPDKQTSRDTIECLLTDNTGKWYGKGWGKHRFLNLLIGKDIKFPKKGLYAIEFEQAIRMDTLANITDIGIRIEKSSQ